MKPWAGALIPLLPSLIPSRQSYRPQLAKIKQHGYFAIAAASQPCYLRARVVSSKQGQKRGLGVAASGRIEELKRRYDENPRRFFAALANEYRKAGDLELAIDLCRQHLSAAPQNLNGQIVFGQALFDAGTLEEAEAAFGVALSIDPENLIALRHLGDIGRAQSDFPRARQWYQRVLDADRRNDEVIAILEELSALEASAPPAAALEATPETATEPPAEAAAPVVEEPAPAPRVSAPAPVPQSQIKTVEIPAMRRPPVDADAISFGDEPAAPAEVAQPEEPASRAPVGFNVDFGAAAGMVDEPMMGSMGAVGESTAFGIEDVPVESPFGSAEEFTPVTPFGTIGRRAPDTTPASFNPIRPITPPEPEPVVEEASAPEHAAAPELVAAPEPPAPETTEPEPAIAAAPTAPRVPAPLEFDVDVDAPPPIRAREGTMPPRAPAAPALDAFELEDADAGAPAHAEATAEFNPVRTLPTPIAPVTPVGTPKAPESFATETMAELYVSQGLRPKAIDVYRELIRARPNDAALRARLAELESDGRGATMLTARKFFSQLATRRATPGRTQTPVPDTPAVEPPPRVSQPRVSQPMRTAEPDVAERRMSTERESALAGLPLISDDDEPRVGGRVSAEFVAEAASIVEEEVAEPASELADEPTKAPGRATLDALFGNPDVDEHDDSAAQSLAAAFGATPPSVAGKPARAANDEVSLDQVFRRAGSATPPGGLSVPRQSATLRFDQFFAGKGSEGSSNAPEPPPADPSGDSEQFQSWLAGLKKQ